MTQFISGAMYGLGVGLLIGWSVGVSGIVPGQGWTLWAVSLSGIALIGLGEWLRHKRQQAS